jgi:hypothetical protein
VTPIVDRLHLPFAALAFSAVVSLMPGFFLFNAATGLVELGSIERPAGSADEHRHEQRHGISDHHATTFGLILPRMLFGRVLPAPA